LELGINGKVAVVAGGNSGIGKATAKLLASEGVNVAIVGKTQSKLDAAANELDKMGEIIPIQADFTRLDAVDIVRKAVLDKFGRVDILVNTVGITGPTKDFLELTDQDWYDTLEIDFMAAVRLCRAFIPLMQESGWGRIVLVASEDALQPYTDEIPYCAAKAAVLNLAKNLSKAYAKDGVLVNSVSPAFIASPMTDAMMQKRAEKLEVKFDQAIDSFLENERPHLELQRRGKVQEVAAVITFLCSQQSSFVVGSNYRVDGGSVASMAV
jgi:NAD(P)-dependent dehydrogenase (short-subunit alcohol dehydrogenase family)